MIIQENQQDADDVLEIVQQFSILHDSQQYQNFGSKSPQNEVTSPLSRHIMSREWSVGYGNKLGLKKMANIQLSGNLKQALTPAA